MCLGVIDMELFKEILVKFLEDAEINIAIPESDAAEIVETRCYKALQKIKAIIEDDSLDDRECFMRIEEIVCLFESLGSDGGGRHDFG